MVPVLSQMNSIYTLQHYFLNKWFFLILSSLRCRGVYSGIFSSDFPAKILYAFLIFPNARYMPRPKDMRIFFVEQIFFVCSCTRIDHRRYTKQKCLPRLFFLKKLASTWNPPLATASPATSSTSRCFFVGVTCTKLWFQRVLFCIVQNLVCTPFERTSLAVRELLFLIKKEQSYPFPSHVNK